MTIRDKVAAYKAAVESFAPEVRLQVADSDALELARSLDAPSRPAILAAGIARVEALSERPADDAALADWAIARKGAFDALWEGLEGEIVDGVEIIRRRA